MIGRDLAEAKLIRTDTETDEAGKQVIRHQIRKRSKDHGYARYYAIPTRHLFELDEPAPVGPTGPSNDS